jgi:hypothetical protein
MLPATEKKVKRKNYLNNVDMLEQVRQSLAAKKMTDEFTNMMILLTERYGNHPNFCNYTYNDDMKAYAIYMICRTWHRFNPERSDNPFAFFTQCIKHSFYQYLNKEKKQRNIRDELLIDSGMNPSNTYISEYESDQSTTSQSNDELNVGHSIEDTSSYDSDD